MVFSFFKKDPKEKPRPGKPVGTERVAQARPAPRAPVAPPVARPAPAPGRPVGEGPAVADREVHRSIAAETAAKIDKIETEMARDFLRPPGRDTGGGPITAANNSGMGNSAPAPVVAVSDPATSIPLIQATTEDDEFDPGTDVLSGSIDAIEINTSGAGSVIDETAILFSNGQLEAAEAVLRAGVRADDLGPATLHAWLMLFELVNQRGDKAAFEQLTMEYALRFENTPPAWFDYIDAPMRSEQRVGAVAAVAAAPASGAPVVRLPDKVDGSIVKQLEALKNFATAHVALTLDLSSAQTVDLVGAELLLRVINAFKRARHELTLAGAEQFLVPLRGAIEPGRRDATDAAWMLMLEVLRVLDRQNDFDETAIQYCITFEVSPPSWEPPPPNLKAGAATIADALIPAAEAGSSNFEWRGAIEGEGEPHFGRLLVAARTNPRLIVDCAQLRRVAFSAASAMLTLARRTRQAGAAFELHNVNPLVAALLHLLGVTTAASVQLRRG